MLGKVVGGMPWRHTAQTFGDTEQVSELLDQLEDQLPPNDRVLVAGQASRIAYGDWILRSPAAYVVTETGFYAARQGMARVKTIPPVPATDLPERGMSGVGEVDSLWKFECETVYGRLVVYLSEPTAAEAIADTMNVAYPAVQVHSANAVQWARSSAAPPLTSDEEMRLRMASAEAEARDRRQARRYGAYWAVITVLFSISAIVGLATGDAWGLLALFLAGGSGWYSRYLYRGGRVRFMIIPIPFF